MCVCVSVCGSSTTFIGRGRNQKQETRRKSGHSKNIFSFIYEADIIYALIYYTCKTIRIILFMNKLCKYTLIPLDIG